MLTPSRQRLSKWIVRYTRHSPLPIDIFSIPPSASCTWVRIFEMRSGKNGANWNGFFTVDSSLCSFSAFMIKPSFSADLSERVKYKIDCTWLNVNECFRVMFSSETMARCLPTSTLPLKSFAATLPSCKMKSTGFTTPDLEHATLHRIMRTFFKRSSLWAKFANDSSISSKS